MENVLPAHSRVLMTLSHHHEQILSLLGAIRRGGPGRDALVRELFIELRVHSILEQQLMFPYLGSCISREQVKTTGKDFYVMLALMLELEQVRSGTEAFENALAIIAKRFEQHAAEQDAGLFRELENQRHSIDFFDLDERIKCRKQDLCEKMRSRMTPKVADETGFAGVQVARHIRCA